MDMEKTINIFGIEIDNKTAKESMKSAIAMMDSDGLSTIELITMDMLLKEQENQEMKEAVRRMDLVLPGTNEILKTAGLTGARCLQRPSERPFLQMFLKYLQKNKKRIFLLADNEGERETAADELMKTYKGLMIVGSAVMPEENSEDQIVNEINGLEVDCILSVLASPRQELFISHTSTLLNAKVWVGMSGLFREKQEEQKHIYKIKNFLIRKLFRHQVDKQKKQE